jgi:hypothetical protein
MSGEGETSVCEREDATTGCVVIGRKCGEIASEAGEEAGGDKNMGIIANGGVFLIF